MHIEEFLKENWAILTTLVGLIVSYVRMEQAVKRLAERDNEQEEKIKSISLKQESEVKEIRTDLKATNLQYQEIKVAIKGIETTLEFIKEKVK